MVLREVPMLKLTRNKHSAHRMKLAKASLQAFNNAIQEVLPQECVRKSLQLDGNQLTVQGRQYELNHNVHIVAIGKAAVGMVEVAEAALGDHVVDGIASVPVGSRIPDGLKTKFYTGAEHNLPDAAAAENARRIEQFLERVRAADQIVLFLISGGGSALLPAPVPGISLEEKLVVIKLLAQNGADIKQLNIARIALSRLKGGKLARKAAPAKCISLIISDIVGDPIDLISSGPTVLSRTDKRTPQDVLRELDLTEKVPRKILDLFEAAGSDSAETQEVNDSSPDIHNAIVCNNRALLESISTFFNASNIPAHIVTSELTGDATELGAAFADLMQACVTSAHVDATALKKLLAVAGISVQPQLANEKQVVLLFGGESTVRFDAARVSEDAKGGRNQEMTLAAFHRLREVQQQPSMLHGVQFAFLSLGSDGQDGPTDATGAFVTSDDITRSDTDEIKHHLLGKNSYGFWSKYNGGSNLVKTGKTGTNLMDVMIVYINFS